MDNWEFKFPANTSSKKIQLRITLFANSTDQTTTPTFFDFVVLYRPTGHDKYIWQLGLNCSDVIQLLDKETIEPKKGIELRNLLRVAEWNNKLVDFEDVDYVETQLDGALAKGATTITVDSTSGFPEQGRLRIDDEEMTYTGKSYNTFTGVTRGVRGTRDVAHSDNTAVNNLYKVFVVDYQEQLKLSNDAQSQEFLINITLVEG